MFVDFMNNFGNNKNLLCLGTSRKLHQILSKTLQLLWENSSQGLQYLYLWKNRSLVPVNFHWWTHPASSNCCSKPQLSILISPRSTCMNSIYFCWFVHHFNLELPKCQMHREHTFSFFSKTQQENCCGKNFIRRKIHTRYRSVHR